MQTFIPYPDFTRSVRALDRQRLGKQRVECLQLLNALTGRSKGWTNHPATRMWRGHEVALAAYGVAVCDEWVRRGYKDTCRDKIIALADSLPEDSYSGLPSWWGLGPVHASHRSRLLQKDREHYQAAFGLLDVQVDRLVKTLPDYIWPTP